MVLVFRWFGYTGTFRRPHGDRLGIGRNALGRRYDFWLRNSIGLLDRFGRQLGFRFDRGIRAGKGDRGIVGILHGVRPW